MHPLSAGEANEAQQQIAYADVVVLNKTDLVGEEGKERAEVRASVLAINPGVHVIETVRHVGRMPQQRPRGEEPVAETLLAFAGCCCPAGARWTSPRS